MNSNTPNDTKLATNAIWASIATGVIIALIEKAIKSIGTGEFFSMLVIYGVYCIFPFKLDNGSNAARYFFVISNILSIVFYLGAIGDLPMRKLELLNMIIGFVLFAYSCKMLFTKDSNNYFGKK
jgi:hypothetical protein